MNRIVSSVVVVLFVFGVGRVAHAAETGDADLLANLRAGHPRLLARAADWADLRARSQHDVGLARLLAGIETDARRMLPLPPLAYQKVGRRLLGVSREAERRVLVWALAWRVTGDDVFRLRTEQEMRAVAAFADWNPSHFLDVAEMTTALAIGYDWLYDALSPEARTVIRQAIVEKGLRPGTDPQASQNSWQRTENNWNQVCFGGLTLGALAVAEDEPELAGRILALARGGIGHGLKPYAPDGVYPEGPSYWSYGTSFQVLMIAALETALGTDWGLCASPGFLASAGAYLQTTGPSGLLYNYADGREQRALEPALFWFAQRTRDPGLLQGQMRLLDEILTKTKGGAATGETARLLSLAAIWWPADLRETAPSLPRYWMGRGPNPIAIFRSSWTDPGALYLAFKGGAAALNHAHMDAGSFVFETDGVRWARDLGLQEYESLESKGVDLWNRAQNSQRWQVFRLNNRSHSTLTIDDQLHRVDGHARIIRFSAAEATPGAVVDLTPVFGRQATRVWRGFRMIDGRGVLVQDELAGLTPGARVRWAMVTGAEIGLAAGEATLRERGKSLRVRLLAPVGAVFEVTPADPPLDDFNAPNPGRRILTATVVAATSGTLRIAVLLQRGVDQGADPDLTPLENWPLPAAD